MALKGVEDAYSKHTDKEDAKGIKAHFRMDENGVLSLETVSYCLYYNEVNSLQPCHRECLAICPPTSSVYQNNSMMSCLLEEKTTKIYIFHIYLAVRPRVSILKLPEICKLVLLRSAVRCIIIQINPKKSRTVLTDLDFGVVLEEKNPVL